MPDPFNAVADLMGFVAFRMGKGGPSDMGDTLQAASIDGEFAKSQYESALQRARNEIYARAGRLANDEYADWRKEQLTEAELWLAASRIYFAAGERIAAKFPEANLQSHGETALGADTPDPYSKFESWRKAAMEARRIGLDLLNNHGLSFDMRVGTETEQESSCLGVSYPSPLCCNCEVL